MPLEGATEMEAVRKHLNDWWGGSGWWEVCRVLEDGLLAVGLTAEVVQAIVEAGFMVMGRVALRAQRWTVDVRGTYPIPREFWLCLKLRGYGASSQRCALAGPLLAVEVSVRTQSQWMVPPVISLVVGEELFFVWVVIQAGEHRRRHRLDNLGHPCPYPEKGDELGGMWWGFMWKE